MQTICIYSGHNIMVSKPEPIVYVLVTGIINRLNGGIKPPDYIIKLHNDLPLNLRTDKDQICEHNYCEFMED